MPLTSDDKLKYKALYLQTAKPYVNQMSEVLKELKNGQEDAEKLEVMHRAAHSMASQSQMMEFTNLGQLSGLIEKICKAKIEKTLEFNQQLVDVLTQAVEKMQASLTEIEANDKELDLSSEITSVRGLAPIANQ